MSAERLNYNLLYLYITLWGKKKIATLLFLSNENKGKLA